MQLVNVNSIYVRLLNDISCGKDSDGFKKTSESVKEHDNVTVT